MRTKSLFIVFMSLVLANLIYFIWAQGFLSPLGLGSQSHLETERLNRQLEPDHIIIGLNKTATPQSAVAASANQAASNASSATSTDVASVATPATQVSSNQVAALTSSTTPVPVPEPVLSVASTTAASVAPVKNKEASEDINVGQFSCQQSALLTGKQVAQVKTILQKKFPANSWKISQLKVPSGWLVYMGKYPDKKEFAKKEQELKTRGVDYEIVKNPKLQPGFVLASFDSEEKANDAKRSMIRFGIRTAKVVEDDSRQPNSVLVIPKLSKALKPQLEDLKEKLPGYWLGACDRNTPR